ncbi:MAG: hypothetical protein KF718_31235 [Polyangiaceae bacterium]|nr:hypothetical protein [Polyangiaceae bacterium]
MDAARCLGLLYLGLGALLAVGCAGSQRASTEGVDPAPAPVPAPSEPTADPSSPVAAVPERGGVPPKWTRCDRHEQCVLAPPETPECCGGSTAVHQDYLDMLMTTRGHAPGAPAAAPPAAPCTSSCAPQQAWCHQGHCVAGRAGADPSKSP